MERLQIHRWSNGAGLGLGPEYSGSPLQKLRLPLRDLVDVNVELLRQFDQRLLALQGSQSNFRFETRAVVPSSSLLIRSHHGRCQAKIPLSPLFKFAEPPLTELINRTISTEFEVG